jgi:peptidyl-tRNA hydrolase, PTH1 family
MHVVVGLGNPGARYGGTRHNIGFEVVEFIAHHHGVALKEKKFKAHFGRGHVGTEPVMLVCPQTFMNRSGDSIGPLVGFYKLKSDSVVVIHDDLDLPVGVVKVKSGGGHGGHNGLRDLVSKLGNANFQRVRVGIGRPQGPMATSDWVLSRWASSQKGLLQRIHERAAEATLALLEQGVTEAMNQFNGHEPIEQ